MTTCHPPQADKQTYGMHCTMCGEIWDGYQVPAPIDVVLRSLDANRTCWKCQSTQVNTVMPWRYEEMKAEKREGNP